MPEPAQKTLVERFISWPRVEDRLRRYPAIGRAFPLTLLRRHRDTPPYFCHYMGWRLGTWYNEALFQRLEELLLHVEPLPGWSGERSLLETPDYAAYWALVWQLQVGEHLCSVGTDVRCGNPGPDFSAEVNGTRLFVECYCYRKSFGIASFLEDVLMQIGPDIKLDHDYFMPFSLPSNDASTAFLDRALAPFLGAAQLQAWRDDLKRKWPIKISTPASSLVIYLDGDDFEVYDPNAVPQRTGEPQEYIPVFVREAISAKGNSNQLDRSRPNLVAANYLLSVEAQLALHLREINFCPILGPNIDGLTMSAAGIDQRLTRSDLVLLPSRPPRDPALEVVARPL